MAAFSQSFTQSDGKLVIELLAKLRHPLIARINRDSLAGSSHGRINNIVENNELRVNALFSNCQRTVLWPLTQDTYPIS